MCSLIGIMSFPWFKKIQQKFACFYKKHSLNYLVISKKWRSFSKAS